MKPLNKRPTLLTRSHEASTSHRASPSPKGSTLHEAGIPPDGKKSFLVYKNSKYSIVATDNIAFFFGSKLLVKLTAAAPDKPLVSKEKVSTFLSWLENR
jgi:hypothetical protein